ncbi:MAG: SpoIID/LytB domain-containing protein [Blastocatellia bacterium]
MKIEQEPMIQVGLMTGAREVRVDLAGPFSSGDGEVVEPGVYTASATDGMVSVRGRGMASSRVIMLAPADFDSCRFTVHGIKIGIDFHWQREESQQFQGRLKLVADRDGLILINELPLESYLVSVISSEMSASCPAELLRAHAIVSRSWLLAQLLGRGRTDRPAEGPRAPNDFIRWYGRESHSEFDVCADDHCQRYQGISKAFSRAAFDAVRDTRGIVLVHADEVCDTRYSKSCGGMTEVYRAAWEDKDIPYLRSVYDHPENKPSGYRMPLSGEANAEAWITSSPPAWCAEVAPELLERIMPAFDQETRDFYRWRVVYTQGELGEILNSRLNVDFRRISALVPLERGESGRIVRLKIVGERDTLIIGKELEIRRAMSRSHLYSSAFVVRTGQEHGEYPASFELVGAGWGHGVGLCQIGAAVMADRGHGHQEILEHYFRGADTRHLY